MNQSARQVHFIKRIEGLNSRGTFPSSYSAFLKLYTYVRTSQGDRPQWHRQDRWTAVDVVAAAAAPCCGPELE